MRDFNKLVLIEFNELCPSLLAQFMQDGILPNFSAFYEEAEIYITQAGEQHPNLEPWIQWLTIHSGIPYNEHKLFHLGDGRKLQANCVAQILSDAGVPAGVFGSMNNNYRKLNGYYIPDPWDQSGQPFPEALKPFHDVISRQVLDSTKSNGLSKRDVGRFLYFLASHGISLSTLLSCVRQMLHDNRNPGLRWRRAMLLDLINYDIFCWLNRNTRARFATFFSNSTAHFQHYFWRDMEPGKFTIPVPSKNDPSLKTAVPDGYVAMDRLMGRFMRDYPDALLVFCTALSQQPWIDTSKCTFRPRDFHAFLKFAGVQSNYSGVRPVMAEQFHIDCASDHDAMVIQEAIQKLSVDGKPLMFVRRNGSVVFAGCRIYDDSALHGTVESATGSAPFDTLFYMIGTMRSGKHHPDGALWVRTGRHKVYPDRVPIVDIAPSILEFFHVGKPAYMRGQPLQSFVPAN